MRETLDIVIPVFNEEECINQTISRLLAVREDLNDRLEVSFIFVDDGSKDKTLEILKDYAQKYNIIKVLSFSRNFGHQFAVSAGIDNSNADYVAIIDGDLQDPPELIGQMYEKAKAENLQVVYGQRKKRKKESIFKKVTAYMYYRVFDVLCQTSIPKDTGDFRLISKEVVDALKQMPEKHRFLRGMIPWVGFNSAPIYYDRDERIAGTTHYPLSKMLKLAFDGIMSFTTKPLRFIHFLACFMHLLAFVSLLCAFTLGNALLLITLSIIAVTLFVGGVLLFAIGILGEYIGRIFEELKNRPIYIIKEKINF